MGLARANIRVSVLGLLILTVLGVSVAVVTNRVSEKRPRPIALKPTRTPCRSVPSCVSGWHVSSGRLVPGLRLEQPLAAAAVSSSDVWAVGRTFAAGSSTDEQPLTEHFDGSRWRAVAGPSVPGGSLEAAAAIASDDVWAVGNVNMGQPLIEHWDGRAWTVVHGAAIGRNVPRENERQLLAIAAVGPADIWVLGQYSPTLNGESTSRDVFEHWNGKAWTIVPSPQDVSTSGLSAMQDISAVASNDVWAVGGRTRGFGEAGRADGALVEHWDGRDWKRVTTPTGDAPLSTVAAISHSDVWAARGGGFTTAQGSYGAFSPPQVLHWNGRAWKAVSAPRLTFLAMTALGPKDVWAAGTRGKWNNVPFIAHWNGSRWSVLPDSLHEPVPRTSYMSLSMRRALDGTIVAFGSELNPSATPQNRLWFRCVS